MKHISVPFYIAGDHRTCVVNINYTLTIEADTLLIDCVIENENQQLLDWLQLDSFELKARFLDGQYRKLANPANRVKSLDGILFMESVYEAIMRRENETLLAGTQ